MWKSLEPESCNETGIRLKDGKCWSKNYVYYGYAASPAQASCSGIWRVPSSTQYQNLFNIYNNPGDFIKDWGDSGYFWTSDFCSVGDSSGVHGGYRCHCANISAQKLEVLGAWDCGGDKITSLKVRCISD